MASEIDWDAWPDCKVSGCHNKCCLRLRSEYCYPHTLGLPVNFLTAIDAESKGKAALAALKVG